MRAPRGTIETRAPRGTGRIPTRRGTAIPFGSRPRAPVRRAPTSEIITRMVRHGGQEFTLRVFPKGNYATVSGIIKGKMTTRRLDPKTFNRIYVKSEPAPATRRTPGTRARKSMGHAAIGIMANNGAVQSAVGHFIVQLLHHI